MWLLGIFKARVLENLVFWHGLSPTVKKVVTVVLAAAVGAVADSLIVADVLTNVEPVVTVSLLAAANWIVGQKEYTSIKSGVYASTTRAEAAQKKLDSN